MALELISRGGAAQGKPQLLFVPGAFHDARCWDHHLLPWFAERGWAAHAVSLRGHGQSSGDLMKDKPGLADYVADINETIEKLGGDVVLIGHSMGGVLVQMARAENKAVAGAVLYASSPMRASLGVAWRLLRSHPAALFKAQVLGDTKGGMPAFVSFFYGDDLPAADRQTHISQLCNESPRAIGEVFSRAAPLTPDLETRPVLVVAGEGDWSIPMKNHHWLAEQYNAPLKVVPGAHCLMVDPSWEKSALAIEEWLTETFLSH